jgi:hypothetical protein
MFDEEVMQPQEEVVEAPAEEVAEAVEEAPTGEASQEEVTE